MILSLKSTVRRLRRRSLRSVFGLLPPLAPPVAADQDPQLGMPAVREVVVSIQIVHAVVAPLITVRLTLQHRVLGEVLELQRELLVDLFGLRLGQCIVCHFRGASLPKTWLALDALRCSILASKNRGRFAA